MGPAGQGVRSPFGQRVSGAWAALRVPWHLRGSALEALVRTPTGEVRPGGASGASGMPRSDPAAAPAGEVRAAMRAIRILARLRIPPFRNTCLFRSVAECLVLRRNGVPAVVRIGVRTDPPTGAVLAHAWVECPGPGAGEGAGETDDGHAYVVFNPEGDVRDRR